MKTQAQIVQTKSAILSLCCPKCGRRAFDVLTSPKGNFKIQLKCPNCHKIVTIAVPDLQ